MTRKYFFYMMVACLLTACSSKNPGMSKEEAEQALKEEAEQEAAAAKMISVAVTEFSEDYTPPAGIKFQSKVVNSGAITLDIQAALKNVRPLKMSELGEIKIHRVGVSAIPIINRAGTLITLKEGYLLNAVQGLYRLDKDFKLVKQLFKNDVEISNGDMPFVSPRQMIYDIYYDAAYGQLRCTFIHNDEKQKKRKEYLITFSLDALLASESPLQPEAITSKLPIKLAGNNFAGIEGGFLKLSLRDRGTYTFGVKGDTLCSFELGNRADYESGGIPRSGEFSDSYIHQNKTYFRMPYSNTIYRLEDASTLKAVYQLNFGSFQRATKKEVTSQSEIDNLYFIQQWFESDRHLFLFIAKGYNSPNNRDAGKVSLYTLIYDKQTKAFFSIPSSKGKEITSPMPEADGMGGLAFFPNYVVDGMLTMMANGKNLKEACSKDVEALGLTDIADNELFIITIK